MSEWRLLLATRSAGKLRELRPMFAEVGMTVTDPATLGIAETDEERALEEFDTFEENALAKARYFARHTALATVADDSGLEVVALGGRPGVRSKRWSGRSDLDGLALDEANNQKLASELAAVVDRSARYVCVAAYVYGGRELVERGETSGRIVLQREGDGGFGYDPFFFSDELGRTFGSASREAKEAISHRGRALRALITRLERNGEFTAARGGSMS